jgi:chemotaxis protein methyltransferase CheR
MIIAFARLRRALEARTGIALGADQQYLAESRLSPIMRAHGFVTMAPLVEAFEQDDDPGLVQWVVDAMTTNETLFFRDRTPFETFREHVLPSLMELRAATRRLRVWSAACSTGQEAYSVAMTLEEEARALRGWSLDILASDLSIRAVEAARAGSYSQFEVQRGLPTGHLLRYFHRKEESWRINEHLRARVAFRDFNLLWDFAPLGKFDAIFCRNVLMYFEPETRRSVLTRLEKALNPGGFLFLGASEGAAEAGSLFAPVSGDGVWQVRDSDVTRQAEVA